MIREMLNIMSPMRDGVLLACNVFRPDDDKSYPAILLRTPYIKERIDIEDIYADYRELAACGYNVVFQDVRGTGASDGVLDATGANEVDDGYDTVEWVAAQPWCDGNVGMQGLSYFGYVQMAAAENNPPHLKAICPFQNSSTLPFSMSKAGTFGNYHLAWVMGRILDSLDHRYPDETERERIRQEIKHYLDNWNEVMFKLPMYDTPAARIDGVPQLKSYLALLSGIEDPSFLERAHRPIKIENIKVPMLMLTGWFDGARDGTIDNWHRAAKGALPASHRKLVIGPWQHGGRLTSEIEGRDFGGGVNAPEVRELIKRWFDCWLKGEQNGIIDEPPVRLLTLGGDWHYEQEWPPKRAKEVALYINAGQDKNSGVLSVNAPANQLPQTYVYDPDDPMPSSVTDSAGRRMFADPAYLQNRDDVLVYLSSALDKDMEVSGLVKFRLFASTDATDTDFVCRMSEVDETGYAFPHLTGLVRGRFRNGNAPELLTPNEVYEFEIEMGNISSIFKAGHRIRVDITSSYYPEHDRNLNTSDRIGFGAYSIKATQTIYHDTARPSRLIFPVIE